MNIDRMINMLLIKLSQKNDVFYMEKRTYKNSKCYKSYILKVDDDTNEFKGKIEILYYLKELV